jgi:hypothetical protein
MPGAPHPRFSNPESSSRPPVRPPLWNRATTRAFIYFLLCLALSAGVILFFTTHKTKMDECAYNVIDAAHSVQDFAKTYGYKTGDHVDNLWPRLYIFMQDQYSRGALKHKPLRFCPDTGQEYDCSNIIPQPGTPVILCKYPPHRETIKIVP